MKQGEGSGSKGPNATKEKPQGKSWTQGAGRGKPNQNQNQNQGGHPKASQPRGRFQISKGKATDEGKKNPPAKKKRQD